MGVEPGVEDQLRDALEQMLRIAHERAKPLQAKRDADDKRESTEAAARAEAAEEQQQHFRSFGSDANS